MKSKHSCPYCGKENPVDSRGRSVIFCSQEHKRKYTLQKHRKEKHYCIVCGKLAKFSEIHYRWNKTCGSKECIKQVASDAQKIGVDNRNKLNISEQELIELYINQNKSRKEIAEYYHCSEANIKKYLRIHKIKKGIANRDIHTKATKLKLHGDPKYINVKKRKQTCKKKYGAPSNLCLYQGVKPNNSSKKEINWIQSLNISTIIPHYTIKVSKIKWYIVDGYDPNTNTVYEFLGDYFHGNPDIFNPNKINKTSHKRMKTLYKETFYRFSVLKKLGYKIIYIWENDYNNHKNFSIY